MSSDICGGIKYDVYLIVRQISFQAVVYISLHFIDYSNKLVLYFASGQLDICRSIGSIMPSWHCRKTPTII